MQSGGAFARSLLQSLRGSGSHRAALQHLSLATISDHGLLSASALNPPVPSDIVLIYILSAPLGCNRNKFLRMLSSPDIDRARRDARAAAHVSQDVLRRAVSTACALADPQLTPLLLAWILQEEQDEGDQGQLEDQCAAGHDVDIERMIISLPRSAADDARLRAALQSSRCVRGALLSRLLQIQAGQTSWAHAVSGLSVRDFFALFWLCLRSKWAVERPLQGVRGVTDASRS